MFQTTDCYLCRAYFVLILYFCGTRLLWNFKSGPRALPKLSYFPISACGPDPGGCANLSSFCNRVSYIRQYCKVTCNVCIATQPTAVPPTTTITITTTTATTATTPVPPSAQEACIDKDSDCSRWKQHCKASGWMQRNCKVTCSLCGSGEFGSSRDAVFWS